MACGNNRDKYLQSGRITLDTLVLASARWIPSCEGREPLLRQTLGFVFLRFTLPLHFQLRLECPLLRFVWLIVPHRKPADTRRQHRSGKASSPLSFRSKFPFLSLCLPSRLVNKWPQLNSWRESSSRVLSLPHPLILVVLDFH